MTNRVFIYDAIRTPRAIAKEGGGFIDLTSLDLLKPLYHSLQSRNSLDVSCVEDVILGCVSQVGEQGGNIAKASLVYADWPDHVPGITINRFCSSSLDATCFAADRIAAGSASLLVTGGVESMSRVGLLSDKPSWMFDIKTSIKVRAVPLGIGADLLASIEGLERKQLDEYTYQSQQRAKNAQQQGYFAHSIIALENEAGDVISQDQAIRADVSIEKLGSLKPSFADLGAKGVDQAVLALVNDVDEIKHDHTAASSPSMVDAASLLLIGNEEIAAQLGLIARAEVIGHRSYCGDMQLVLSGGTETVKLLLKEHNLAVSDIDLVEFNESYAGPTLKFINELGFSPDIVNVNGGALSLGHPMGATGGILIGMLVDELERQDKSLGLVAICGAAGSGTAMLIKRI